MHCPDLIKSHVPNQSHIDFLSAIGVTFPIRNKAKSINTNIVNYQFEGGFIKQEMFMMEFDLYQLIEDARLVPQIIPIDFEANSKSIIFKINGVCHGKTVFSDELHYLIKGNKLIKCAIEQINNYRNKVL